MVTEMTERRIHYHRNGGVTARLELVMPDGGDFPESFARRHADAVGAAFDGGFSKNADDAFDAARARDISLPPVHAADRVPLYER